MTRSRINRRCLISSWLLCVLYPLHVNAEDKSDTLEDDTESTYIDDDPETLEVFVRGSTRANGYDDMTFATIVESAADVTYMSETLSGNARPDFAEAHSRPFALRTLLETLLLERRPAPGRCGRIDCESSSS